MSIPRLLVVLPNHELPPSGDSPGISHIIHNQLNNFPGNLKVMAVSLKSSENGSKPNAAYDFSILNKHMFMWISYLLMLVPYKLRKRLFGVSSRVKIARSFGIMFYFLLYGWRFKGVVIHNYILPLQICLFVNKIYKRKIFYYSHMLVDESNTKLVRIINRSDGLITIANERLEKITVPRVNIVNNHTVKHSIAELDKREYSTKKVRIVSTSNIDENKNIAYAISLLNLTSKVYGVNFEFDIYGKILDRTYYNEQVFPFLNERIQFKGSKSRAELLLELKNYDYILQLTKNTEANSMSVIEAIVEAQVPAIVSNIGGLPFVLNEGDFGYIIDLGTKKTDQAEHLGSIFFNHIKYKEVCDKIKQSAELFFSPKLSGHKLSEFVLDNFEDQ